MHKGECTGMHRITDHPHVGPPPCSWHTGSVIVPQMRFPPLQKGAVVEQESPSFLAVLLSLTYRAQIWTVPQHVGPNPLERLAQPLYSFDRFNHNPRWLGRHV